jgi:hypothetical protein
MSHGSGTAGNSWHCACSQVLVHAQQGVALQPVLIHMLSCILLDFVNMRQNALRQVEGVIAKHYK